MFCRERTTRAARKAQEWLSLGIALFLFASSASRAFADGPQPNRVLKVIDFEERKLGNEEDLPMHWDKISGAGLPHYVNGILATDRAHSGQYSFRFDLNGGSLVYRYDPTQIPILSGAHYRVEVYCQTTVLPNARARLTAYFTDSSGQPLPDMVRHSELYAAKADQEGWKLLSVQLNADDSRAAYLAVELELLQPELYTPAASADGMIFPQDINGSAWFDDVTVAQVPDVTLATAEPANIFRLGEPLQLSVTINDLFTGDLQSRLSILNADGQTIYQRSGALGAVTTNAATERRLIVPLPGLEPGWYRANLQVTSHGNDLGEHSMALIQLGDTAEPIPPDDRFGVIATGLEGKQLEQLPLILPLLSAGRVKIAVWTQHDDLEESDPSGFDSLLESLQSEGISPTGCLLDLPPSIAKKVGGGAWIRLLHAGDDSWQPQLAFMISRHAEELSRWQFGSDDADVFVTDPQMRQVYQLLYNQFAQLMNNPDLAMPWPAWYDVGDQLPATIALSVPPQVLPEHIPLYMHDLQANPGSVRHHLSLTIQPLDESYPRVQRLRDLAQRVIYAVAGGADRIDLPLPFSVEGDDQNLHAEPSELFVVDRTLMRTLDGAVFKGEAPLGDGVDALLFDRGGQGILAVWSRSGDPLPTPITLNLGPDPMKVDLWGGITPLPRVGDDVRVDVGPMPFFIVGVDSVTAQLRSALAFDKPLLESSFQSHERRISFVNPSANPLSGSLRLRPPPGWTFTPATFQFALGPGEKFNRSITIDFPYNSIAGPKTIRADFNIDGDQPTQISVPLTLTLGLSDVGMRSLALRDGKDLIVQQMITNYGETPIDYTAYAVYPGAARQERLISGLPAGRSTIKLYRFKNVKFLPDATVRCGIRQLEGMRVLNDEVAIQ
ncbi:MAG TPA: NEW3 domain-containing protein [Tepidisphaeraceae bacterium]|nr:NEW3 domain-containing protein [Tepidisphaeraceae bacterium]